MSDLPQKTYDAFKAGANFPMDESYNVLSLICMGLLFMSAGYVVLCIAKGIGNDSIKFGDIPNLILRMVLLILIISCFLYY